MAAVTLDFSKAQPLPQQGGVKLDFSKAQPIATARPAGLPAGVDLPGLPAHPAINMPTPAGASVVPALLQAGEVAKGAAKGALHTVSGTDNFARQHLPAVLTNSNFGFGAPADEQHVQDMATPTNTAQKIGFGGEQIGEFFAPTGLEEAGGKLLGTALGKGGAVAGKLLGAGIHSGAVNTAQGGNFGTGAVGGVLGSGIGQGLAAVAPRIAESALNIRKLDRAYGKNGGTIGQAILDKTNGLTPGAVADSAQSVLDRLNPQLNEAVDRASVRPNPVRGLLPAPAEEIPLHSSAAVAGTPSQPVTLNQVDRPMLRGLPGASADVPMSSHTGIFPDQLPSASSSLRAPLEGGSASGFGPGQYIGQIPGERGGPGQVQGVLLRKGTPEPFQIPSNIPNPTASLGSARGVLAGAVGKAANQGERTTLGQLDPMMTHLGQTVGGDPIPDNVTPRQLLDLKRGFGNEFIHRWNPETMNGVKGTAAQTYHALGDELNNAVPEAAGLNSQISTMIPVAKRAESAELNAPTTQRLFQRIAAPTGALTGALGGGAAGYEHGGKTGAIEGASAGLLAPLLLSSPTGQMMLARTLNGLARPISKAAVGAGLQMSERNKSATAAAPK